MVSIMLVVCFVRPWSPTRALASEDKLPDLQMAPLADIVVDEDTEPEHRLLRFTTIVKNAGPGPFEVRGKRPDLNTELMTTTQRIYNTTDGYRDVPTSAVMYYAHEDDHRHWHMRELESIELLGASGVVARGVKLGYCFFDNVRFDGAQNPQYRGCGHQQDLKVKVGLSPDWGDAYYFNYNLQYMDITNLHDGSYCLQATVDESHWFTEVNPDNNSTRANLEIQGNLVKVTPKGTCA
jgi:hypothetical protein